MELTKIFTFDMAHRLSFHEGKCWNLHGHTYRLEVTVSGDEDKNGMVIDFNDMKRIILENVVDVLDHATVIFEKDDLLMRSFPKELKHVIFPTEVTAENLCKWCSNRLEEAGLKIKQVAIWETPTSKAVYTK